MTDIRDTLLAAHVEYELSRLRGSTFATLIDEHVAAAFAWLEDVTANDVVTREQIVGVIQRYVIELRVSGGITELAGEMANVVFSSKASVSTRIGEVCEPTSYSEFADKVVGLEGVQRELVRYVTESAAFGTLASRVLSRIVLDLVFHTNEERRVSRLKELVVSVGQKVLPGFEQRLGEVLARYVEKHASRFAQVGEKHLLQAADRDWVRQMADEIWDSISQRQLSTIATVFTAQDLEDFVILGYEFWLKFRKTPYFWAVVTEVVNHLFVKYGDESLATLISDMGVTEQMVASELRIFLGPLIDHASRTGFLGRELKMLLEPFYRSEEFATVLASRGG